MVSVLVISVRAASMLQQGSLGGFGLEDQFHRGPDWSERTSEAGLDEQDAEPLRRRAAREGRSMQEVARQALREYIERTSRRELLDEVLDEQLPRYAEALERLGR